MKAERPSPLRPETMELLEDLIRLPGVSGHEEPVRQRLRQAWAPFVDQVEVSRLGNLVAHRRSGSPQTPTILLTAHMDAIGLMVSDVVNGFLRLESLGRVDPRGLAGQRVTVLTDEPLSGYVVARPKNLLPEEAQEGAVDLEHLLVDLALDPDEVEDSVQIGDPLSFTQKLQRLDEGRFFGRALDNRVSLAALTEALLELDGADLDVDLIVAATAQEETSRGGGLTLGQQYQPDVAFIVDTTFGRAPGMAKEKTFPVGKGLTVGFGPSLHPRLGEWLQQVADSSGVAWHREVLPGFSGTDADWIQLTGKGVMCSLISIPILNMHTGVEVGSFSDIKACADLLTALARAAKPDLLEGLKWD